jgi:hypothetical protein
MKPPVHAPDCAKPLVECGQKHSLPPKRASRELAFMSGAFAGIRQDPTRHLIKPGELST